MTTGSEHGVGQLLNAASDRPMPPRVLLVDNGSLQPASTLQLRQIAIRLQASIGIPVDPVSLAHSDRVDPGALDGRAAELLEPALDRLLAAGARDLTVVPLFVGPSYAITRHVPAVLAERRRAFPVAQLQLAGPLFDEADERLGLIAADLICEQLQELPAPALARARVVLVDHGSPSAAVAAVRDRIADQARPLLGCSVEAFSPASMERRAGAEFDFNEPQLERLLAEPGWNTDPLVIGLLFIGPGRHAGPGGDVTQIVGRVRGRAAGPVRFSRLLGEHPRLIEILADRFRAAAIQAAHNP